MLTDTNSALKEKSITKEYQRKQRHLYKEVNTPNI